MRETYLPYCLPTIGEEEIREVVDSLRSGWITTGPKTREFEKQFGTYIHAKNAIAVSSCTAGLHIALRALNVGIGDEVIIPTMTFCSTANVAVHLGAMPVLVDTKEDFNINPEAIRKALTSKTKVILPVHYGGQACDLEEIYSIAKHYNLPVVEDCAHAVGCTYNGRKIGSDELLTNVSNGQSGLLRISVFSFYATKNMTTGEGGMITCNDFRLSDRMRLFSLHGMSKNAWKRYTTAGSWYYEVDEAGYKYNMTDIQASLGIHQLRKLDKFIETRQKYADIYDKEFKNVREIEVPHTYPDRNHVYHLYVIKLKLPEIKLNRAQFIDEMMKANIGTSVHFIPVHLHRFYRTKYGYKKGEFPVAERIYESIVSLPLYPKMTENDVLDVAASVKKIITSAKKQ